MGVVAIGTIGKCQCRIICRIAFQRGQDNLDAWLRVATDASRVRALTEPDHAPNALVRRQGVEKRELGHCVVGIDDRHSVPGAARQSNRGGRQSGANETEWAAP